MSEPNFSREFAMLQQLRCQLHIVARMEFEETMTHLSNADPGTEAHIEQLVHRIVNRVIDIADSQLANIESQDDQRASLKVLAHLLGVSAVESESVVGRRSAADW